MADVIGVVRVVDRERRRHSYGFGIRPRGQLLGELGSLCSDGGPGLIEARVSADGRLWTDDDPLPRSTPSLRTALGWASGPLRRRNFGPLDARLRASAGRGLVALTRRHVAAQADGREHVAGFLWNAPGPERLPLYSALHPVTGDQLLSTSAAEAGSLGYEDPILLGYLAAEAPVTGHLGTDAFVPPWSPGLGRPDAAEAGGFAGSVDSPRVGAGVAPDHFVVIGWAMTPAGAASRVEIFVNGEFSGRAALGLPRPDIARGIDDPKAGTCGFETMVNPSRLTNDEIVVEAVAHDAEGRSATIDAVTVHRLPAASTDDADGTAATLRARGARTGPRPARSGSGPARVLVVAHNLDQGGAQRYLYDLVARLSADPGLSFSLASSREGQYGPMFEAIGVPVHVTSRGLARDATEYEGRLAEFAAWAGTKGFDLVFANTIDTHLGADAAQRLGLPCVWSIHESFELPVWFTVNGARWRTEGYARQRAEQALDNASALVFAADATRELYEPYADARRLITFPYGMELGEMQRRRAGFDRAALRAERGIPAEANVVLCLGTIGPRKGQVALAHAFERVAYEHPDALLVIVGEQADAYSAALRSYVEAAGLEDRVLVRPVDPDPYPWHELADVCALASNVESSPLALIEAMTFETPVLATSVFGVPELVREGETGYLCEPGDIGELASALDRALSAGAEERRALGAAGAQLAAARHDPVRYAARFSRLLHGMLESPAALPAQILDGDEPSVPARAYARSNTSTS